MMLAFGTRTFSNFTSACLSAAIVLSCVWLIPGVSSVDDDELDAVVTLRPGWRPTTVMIVGNVRVAHEELRAVEDDVVAVVLDLQRDALRIEPRRRLRVRERPDGLAAGDLRQRVLLLLVGAALEQRQHAADLRRDERARHERPPELLDQDDQVEVPEAGAAVLLGDEQALPALLRHLLPELRRVALLVVFHLADKRLGALLLQEVARRVLQQFLLFRQSQVHIATLSSIHRA